MITLTKTPEGLTWTAPPDFSVAIIDQSGDRARILVTLLVNTDLYRKDNTYDIDLTGQTMVKILTVVATREKRLPITGAGGGFTPGPTIPVDPTQPVRVPIIDIYGQTTFNGEYLSDMTFIIQDEFKYCKSKNIVDPCQCGCDILYIQPNKLKTTTLIDNNIPLQDVVIGKKKTLQDKVLKISTSRGEPNFFNFYERFIKYAMLKYILIRLLYGTYDLCKLCRNFNKQFFKDLSHSRFCGFIEFFDNPDNQIMDFDRYFIKC